MKRGRPRNFNEEEAVAAAMTIFWEKGYEATSCEDLLQAMNINSGSMYSTFGDKHSLYEKAFDHYLNQNFQKAIETLNAPGSALENVKNLVQQWEQAVLKDNFSGCLITLTLIEFANEDCELAVKAHKIIQQMHSLLQTKLEEAKQSGELTAPIAPSDLAAMLVNTVQGLSVLGKAGADKIILQGAINSTLALLY